MRTTIHPLSVSTAPSGNGYVSTVQVKRAIGNSPLKTCYHMSLTGHAGIKIQQNLRFQEIKSHSAVPL